MKRSQFATRRLGYALETASKHALLDVLVNRAQLEAGEDASDEELALVIQGWLTPVLRTRGDKEINLAALLARHDEIVRREQARREAAN